jgi:hypothetical protein
MDIDYVYRRDHDDLTSRELQHIRTMRHQLRVWFEELDGSPTCSSKMICELSCLFIVMVWVPLTLCIVMLTDDSKWSSPLYRGVPLSSGAASSASPPPVQGVIVASDSPTTFARASGDHSDRPEGCQSEALQTRALGPRAHSVGEDHH